MVYSLPFKGRAGVGMGDGKRMGPVQSVPARSSRSRHRIPSKPDCSRTAIPRIQQHAIDYPGHRRARCPDAGCHRLPQPSVFQCTRSQAHSLRMDVGDETGNRQADRRASIATGVFRHLSGSSAIPAENSGWRRSGDSVLSCDECYPIPTPALPLKGREQPTLSVTPSVGRPVYFTPPRTRPRRP